jgi:uncharacterized surface protein with fasciclin (FAS1) repeats
LVTCIEKFPDILGAMRGDKKDLTLFAPTNDAFEELGILPEGDDLLRVLRYHIVGEVVTLNGKLNKQIFLTWLSEPILGGAQRIKILPKNKTFTVNDKVLVIDKNLNATNGIIQVLDTVLLPPPDIFHRLAQQPTKLSMFVDAVSLTDLISPLKKQRLTVFVPSNQAFDDLPKDERKALFSPAGKANLTDLLKRHIVPAVVYLGELEHNEVKLQTLADGISLEVKRRGDKFFVNGIRVDTNDVFGKNGAMNWVDTILPKKPKEADALEQIDSWVDGFRNIVKQAWTSWQKRT